MRRHWMWRIPQPVHAATRLFHSPADAADAAAAAGFAGIAEVVCIGRTTCTECPEWPGIRVSVAWSKL